MPDKANPPSGCQALTHAELTNMKKLLKTPLFLPGAAIFVLGWVVLFNELADRA
jgi:hypothetical protein